MRVASEVALSSTVVVVVVVVVAFVVCANTDDGAKVVPMTASTAITRLTIARTATNIIIIIIIDRFIEQRKRTKLIRVPPDDAWKRFCDFVMMMIDSRRASGRFYCLPVVAVVMHLYEASASRRYELTLARSVARSPVSTRKMMLEPEREISALPPSSSSLSRRFRSGASAARIEPATRPDLVDILILALQFFKVNVVRP
jgi:hypothetical protein